MNFEELLCEPDADRATSLLHTKILEAYNESCPIKTKTVSVKDQLKPWITNSVKTKIKKRHNYLTLLKKGLISQREYNSYRNYVNSHIRFAKKQYYHNAFQNVKNNIKATWSIINKILAKSNGSKSQSIESIIFNDRTYSETYDICQVLNEHFSTVAKKLHESIPMSDVSFNHYLREVRNPSHFSFTPTTENEIENIIMSFQSKKCDISTYPIEALKIIKCLISPLLAKIVNNSLNSGVFPQILKTGRVVPIFKSGDRKQVGNYRPISVLPILSKIFEKVVFNQLYQYFDAFNLLTSCQFGFRRKNSTSDAIINNLQYIYDNLDSGHTVISIFLDFSKAFDCVDHHILLKKMSVYGVCGVELGWFQSYLTNRDQFVSLDCQTSECRPVVCGVPQGSILGPLLFLIFINDFPNSSNFFKFTLFADDSTLTCKFKNDSVRMISNTLNQEMSKVFQWLNSNKIKVNIDKCNFINFSYRKQIALQPIRVNSSYILETDQIKFLGIIIDKHLTFKYHINAISTKISRSVGLLHRLKFYLPPEILKTLYYSFVYPYMHYCIESWFGTSQTVLGGVRVLQKRAIRAIFNLPFNSHTNSFFKENFILKVTDIYRLKLCCFFFRILNDNQNSYISQSINSLNYMHNHNTRNSSLITTPHFNRSTSQRSFMYQAVREWNTLPEHIKNRTNINSFRANLKAHYCSAY